MRLAVDIVYKLVEDIELTDQEALGVARWLLWLQCNGDDVMDVQPNSPNSRSRKLSTASNPAQNTSTPGRKRLKLSDRRRPSAQLALR
jgi:hypothetical protein